MNKIPFIIAVGVLILCFTAPIQGKDRGSYGDSDRYRYQGSNYNGYSSRHDSQDRYYHHEDRDRYRDYKSIHKEINRNEKQIRKLEKKIKKYYRKQYHCSRREYHYYTSRIRELEWEISRLAQRNRHLQRLLHR